MKKKYYIYFLFYFAFFCSYPLLADEGLGQYDSFYEKNPYTLPFFQFPKRSQYFLSKDSAILSNYSEVLPKIYACSIAGWNIPPLGKRRFESTNEWVAKCYPQYINYIFYGKEASTIGHAKLLILSHFKEVYAALSHLTYFMTSMGMTDTERYMYQEAVFYLNPDSKRLVGDWCMFSKPDAKICLFGRGNVAVIVQSEKGTALSLARALDDFLTGKHTPLPTDTQTISRIELLLKEKAEKERIEKELAEKARKAKVIQDMFLAQQAYKQSLENKRLESGLPKAWVGFYLFDILDLLREDEVRGKSHFDTPYTSAPQFNLYDALKWTPLSDTPVIPNVNLGKISAGWLKSKFKGKDVDVKYDEPLGTYVVITDPKTKRYIRVMVAHAPSAHKAQLYMCMFRLVCSAPLTGDEDSGRFSHWQKPLPGKIAEKTLVNFVKVGDFSISNRPETMRFLHYIPSEVESEIIFMRGNTVIGIQDSDPSKSVLKIAELIDKELQRGSK